MIPHQFALMRRELWEHHSIFVTPAAVALVVTLLVLTIFVFAASGYSEKVDLAILLSQQVGEAERRMALTEFLDGIAAVFFIASCILTIFYSLDSLYAERKNKSILFWRSLPITDSETVLSKFLTAVVTIPLVTFAAVAATHLINLIVASIFVSIEGGSPGHLIWGAAPLFDVWFALLAIMLALPVWFSPFIGWFLFVSAWTKRSPLLTAFLPLLVVPMLEYFILQTHYIFDAMKSRVTDFPMITDDSVSILANIDVGKFLSSPAMWAGVVVCGLFITAAIYVRRYRDES